MTAVLVTARLVLASVLAVAGAAKFADREGTAETAQGFGIPRRLAGPAALALPALELVLAAAILAGRTAAWAAPATAALVAAFTVLTAVALARGRRLSCRCFGRLSAAPLGRGTLARNAVLLAVASFAALGPGAPGPGVGAWLASLTGLGRVTFALAAALAVVAAAGAWTALELLKQHGRLLHRLDALDGGGHEPGPEDIRLPLGAAAPEFAAPAWDGGDLTLDGLLDEGLPVALVFTNAACGPCRDAIPELARAQRDLDGLVSVAVVARGTSPGVEADWREHALERIALVDDEDLWLAYGVPGSPGAILVSPDGLVASAPALGVGAILALLEGAVVPVEVAGRPR